MKVSQSLTVSVNVWLTVYPVSVLQIGDFWSLGSGYNNGREAVSGTLEMNVTSIITIHLLPFHTQSREANRKRVTSRRDSISTLSVYMSIA